MAQKLNRAIYRLFDWLSEQLLALVYAIELGLLNYRKSRYYTYIIPPAGIETESDDRYNWHVR